ncbi:MAG TPA: indolepyruvate ferredoxin oxidoreductase family protein [Rhizobiaceae bacterium]|nr:indolepyruvate ferredoxin oxidoreductase family protein [Rhizobiaceae bacterium]
MTLHDVVLDDKYDLSKQRIFVSGAQAVIRMMLMQRERDRLAGLRTAGFVSGYRGSPLGGFDLQLWKAKSELAASDIIFQPGLNEELAATAVWGSQQTQLLGEGKYDGVFGVWYGKGPGVDRSGDVFRHANLAGTSPHGGVLALMGDDHMAESSTIAHATEFLFVDTMIPILNPAGVQELIDYGLYGYALSRFASTWTAIKCVKDNIESTASVDASLERIRIELPEFDMPPGGISIRHEVAMLEQEARLHEYKRAAAAAFIRVNKLNRIIYSGGSDAKIGIITVGKSYLDVRQALGDIGIDEEEANRIGLRLFKVAAPWPLDFDHIKEFAQGLEMIIVVEEKRSLLETQVREHLYGTVNQPVVIGKRDERGDWLFPAKGALDPNDIAIAVGERILRVIGPSEQIASKVGQLKQFQAMLADTVDVSNRSPYFCSGCPHNTSTNVPEGSVAGAGIGCHFMAMWMDRSTIGFTQMGGEGAQWIGQAPFTKREHMFQNLGDGTYNHSGNLAIRFALAAGANITYKILYNDAVAMTGGQPHEGNLTVDMIARQVRAEGVERIAVVSDEPDKYNNGDFPPLTTFGHRDDLDAVQRELRDIPGVTVLIYDQTCAAEKRRRRKRGTYPDPDKRVIINELVCEGCGDCGVKSNCVSVQPLETEFGRKRRIDQSSCNKDFSCVNGFCPSFVTVHGGKLRKAGGHAGTVNPLQDVPQPTPFALGADGWSAIIDGIGGTGVVTIASVVGMAAHLEGKGCGMIDMAGLAQKGGAVFSHVRIAQTPEDIHAIRVSAGKADLILGCDLVVSGNKKILSAVREGHTHFIVNTAEVMPGEFTRQADFSLPSERIKRAIRKAAGEQNSWFFDATRAATVLFGNSVGANMFLLGYAWQHGGVPLSDEAIESAIALNGQSVSMNVSAFRWGRRAAHDPAYVQKIVEGARTARPAELAQTLDAIVERRAEFLASYQNEAYAQRYRRMVDAVREAEEKAAPGKSALAEAVARNLFKAMAIKDEYEVARLYTDGAFKRQLGAEFESFERLEFHLAPPIMGRKGPDGTARKSSFGPWMMSLFRVLAGARRLRGSIIDPFAYSAERRMERKLLARYEADLARIASGLTPERMDAAAGLANIPSLIRGFGHVKAANATKADVERERLLARFDKPEAPQRLQAAE